jgi:hypothetical protein
MTKQTKKNSWNKRTLWQPTSEIDSHRFRDRFSSEISPNSKMMLNGQLIRFYTMNKPISNMPVVFGFNGKDPIAAYLKIFSPDSNHFDGEFYLTFQ